MKLIFILAFIGLLSACGERNTEQVCFDKEGLIVSYAKGFEPGKPPLIFLREGVYKNMTSGEVVHAICRYSWSSDRPKGLNYWKGNKSWSK